MKVQKVDQQSVEEIEINVNYKRRLIFALSWIEPMRGMTRKGRELVSTLCNSGWYCDFLPKLCLLSRITNIVSIFPLYVYQIQLPSSFLFPNLELQTPSTVTIQLAPRSIALLRKINSCDNLATDSFFSTSPPATMRL